MKKKVFIKDVEKLSEDLGKLIEASASLAAKYSKNSKLLGVFSDLTQGLSWRKNDLDSVAEAAKKYDKKKVEEAKAVNALYNQPVCVDCCEDRYDFDFDDEEDEEDED